MTIRRFFIAAGLAAALPVRAGEPLRVLSGGALEPAVAVALERWREAGGDEVALSYATAPRITERLAGGDVPDVLLAPLSLVEELARAGRAAAPPLVVGSVGVGIAVREGAPVPSITDEVTLRAELVAAEAIVFNRASTGLYMERLLDRLGLTAALSPRIIRFPDGDGVLRRIAGGSGREIAFAAATEIALFRGKGVRSAGPLPEGLQNRTTYAAVPMREGAAARRFLAFLGSAEVRQAMRQAGLE